MSKSRLEVNSYFHGPVDVGSGVSADYVIAHAERQKQRGKQPAVVYGGISNPQDALEAARKDVEARTTKAFHGKELPFYLADFSGRVAIMHTEDDERQRLYAAMFVDARMQDGRCLGAIILSDLDEVDYRMPAHQVNSDGSTEVPYLYAP